MSCKEEIYMYAKSMLMIMTCTLDHSYLTDPNSTPCHNPSMDTTLRIIAKIVPPKFASATITFYRSSTMPAKLTPFKDLRVLRHQIPAHGLTPNTSIQNKPLLIYKSTFTSTVTAGEIETHLSSVGVVTPQWRYSMYTTSHFHVSILHFG